MSEAVPVKRKSKAFPIAFMILGVLLVGAAVLLYFDMRAAAEATTAYIAQEIRDTYSSPHLTELKIQWAWIGFAGAMAIAGVLTFLGGLIQLFRK